MCSWLEGFSLTIDSALPKICCTGDKVHIFVLLKDALSLSRNTVKHWLLCLVFQFKLNCPPRFTFEFALPASWWKRQQRDDFTLWWSCNICLVLLFQYIFSFNHQQWRDIIKLFPPFVVRWLYVTNLTFVSLEKLYIRPLKDEAAGW